MRAARGSEARLQLFEHRPVVDQQVEETQASIYLPEQPEDNPTQHPSAWKLPRASNPKRQQDLIAPLENWGAHPASNPIPAQQQHSRHPLNPLQTKGPDIPQLGLVQLSIQLVDTGSKQDFEGGRLEQEEGERSG